jgi:hypothetical protein
MVNPFEEAAFNASLQTIAAFSFNAGLMALK